MSNPLALPGWTFSIKQLVRKKGDKGQWHGRVCGFYSTDITPEGYAVESAYEQGSVQIYPVSALEPWAGKHPELRQKIEGMKRIQSYGIEERPEAHGFVKGHNAALDDILKLIDGGNVE